MVFVGQLGDDGRWYVQLAAIWHQHLPLCIYKLYNIFLMCYSVYAFPFLYFSLT